MAQHGWGAPRIHAELTTLGFLVSEMTVSRYMPRRPAQPDQAKRWVAFLRNHKDDVTAMDLFTVPSTRVIVTGVVVTGVVVTGVVVTGVVVADRDEFIGALSHDPSLRGTPAGR